MSETIAERMVPRNALLGAAALIAFALVAAGVGRVTGKGLVHADQDAASQTAMFRFEDRPDGGISVIAPESGTTLGVLPAGEDGFIRTVLRSFAFDRQRRGMDSEPAFVLSRGPQGPTTIDDPATNVRVDLRAFGAANRQSFEKLMAMRGEKS